MYTIFSKDISLSQEEDLADSLCQLTLLEEAAKPAKTQRRIDTVYGLLKCANSNSVVEKLQKLMQMFFILMIRLRLVIRFKKVTWFERNNVAMEQVKYTREHALSKLLKFAVAPLCRILAIKKGNSVGRHCNNCFCRVIAINQEIKMHAIPPKCVITDENNM